MKNLSALLLLILLLPMASMKLEVPPNVSTWFIYINEENILNSHKHELGVLKKFSKADINTSDTLFIQRNLCGMSAKNSTSSIIISDDHGKELKTYKHQNDGISYSSQFLLNDLLTNPTLKDHQQFRIYFEITDQINDFENKELMLKIEITE